MQRDAFTDGWYKADAEVFDAFKSIFGRKAKREAEAGLFDESFSSPWESELWWGERKRDATEKTKREAEAGLFDGLFTSPWESNFRFGERKRDAEAGLFDFRRLFLEAWPQRV